MLPYNKQLSVMLFPDMMLLLPLQLMPRPPFKVLFVIVELDNETTTIPPPPAGLPFATTFNILRLALLLT